MTLFKQVALLVSLVLLLVVFTITAASLKQYGSIVKGQLQTTAQDMVTTLGIAISNSSFGEDQPAYETLFNAVFDSGYYSSIELVTTDMELIHKKERQLDIEGVPNWFVSLVPIKPATASTQVMQGWTPLGTLSLTLHPGYVYYGLYKNLETVFIWFVVIFSLGMLVLWLLLRHVLKPLLNVRQQADAIHNNQFVKQESLPRTIELRTVVNAMNRMVDKVHAVFDDQEETLIKYQKLLYEDKLTGLGNRQYFLSELESAHSDDAAFQYDLAVIKILNLEYVREHYGYEKSDKAVIALADILNKSVDHDNYRCARLSAEEFAMLVPSGEQSLTRLIENIFEKFRLHSDVSTLRDEISLAAGVSAVQAGRDMGETLADSDFALTQAETCGPYSFREAPSTELELPHGKIQWRSWLESCFDDNKFFLVAQKAFNAKGEAIHQEVFVRLKNDVDQMVPAGMFMPMVSAFNMSEALDHEVFQLVKEIGDKNSEVPVALNLTASVFSHANALLEFNALLKYFQQSTTALCVEASHSILEQYPEMCAQVAESVRESGYSFGIDNMNLGLSLHGMKIVRPDYLKINAQTLYDMTQCDIPAGYQALRTIVKTMDIQLIAVAVDSQTIHDHLQQLGIDAMQGNLLGAPEEYV